MGKSPVAIFIACLVAYHLNGRAQPEVDCLAAPYEAFSLVRHGSFDLRAYRELDSLTELHVRTLPDGSRMSMRTPGTALTALPVVAPFALISDRPPRGSTMLALGKLVGALSVAAAAALFFVVCRRLAPAGAPAATVLFAFGTCLGSVASQALWQHGPATFWLTLALALLTKSEEVPPRRAAAVGFVLGLAVLCRPTVAVFAVATVATFAWGRRWREAVACVAGGAIPAAVMLGMNARTFGDPLYGGYAADNWSASPPLWVGTLGLLVAPSRGLLVYSPALLLAPFGLVRRRSDPTGPADSARPLLLAWTVAAVATWAVYARWHDWRGGWCFGPRFLCETMPVLALGFAIAYDRMRSRWGRVAAVCLVGLSVAIHTVGVYGRNDAAAWQRRHDRPDQGRCLFELTDTQIETHTRSVVRQVFGRPRSREGG